MPTILFAQAGSDDREMYAEFLELAGFSVVVTSTTDAATLLVRMADVLITGLMVPGEIDAIELIAGATQGRWGRTVPVVVVTACTVPSLHARAIAAGAATPVLMKPCLPGELVAAVERVLHAPVPNPMIAASADNNANPRYGRDG